ncbi:MAG TPA: hypothetical protein VJ599_01810 [Nitrososphaeraceae archaeon]|nr:hypothetical protein [Nitrososphaeraceae archaeon]
MVTDVILCTKVGKSILLIGIIFHAIFAVSANQLSYSQNSTDLLTSRIPTETIKIVDPITTQNVSTGQELTISGTSSDTNLKNCSVSVIVNNLRPYQPAIAKGSDDVNDYSQWEFVLGANYTQIVEGENKITGKLECSSASPRWYSVFINGVTNLSNDEVQTTVFPQGEQNTLPSNLSTTNNIDDNNEALTTVPPEEEQNNVPSSDLSITDDADDIVNNEASTTVPPEEEQNNVTSSDLSITDESASDNNDNALLVSIVPLNDPVSRGDSQSVTITVTDSASTAVANAEIDGNLIYPGDNFEKEFSGITDSQGEFVYSWTIGENGDAGPLSVQVEVSSQEHPPTSATISFDVEDLSEESESE